MLGKKGTILDQCKQYICLKIPYRILYIKIKCANKMLNMYFKQNNIYFFHQCEFLVLYQILGGPVSEFIFGSSILFH